MIPPFFKLHRALVTFCVAGLLGIGTAHAKTIVTCVGDSITAGINTSPYNPYTSQLQALLGTANYTVKNFGVPGTTLMDGSAAYTATSSYQNSLTSSPNIVIIQLGTNDAGDATNWKANSSKFVSEYIALINSYQTLSTHPKVYVSLCTWSSDSSHANILAYELLPLTRLAANLTGCDFIDNYYALYQRTYDYVKTDGTVDVLHPNAVGYGVLARSIYDFLTFDSSSANFGATNSSTENLNDKYTLNAIDNDTTAYSATGGIDGKGHAYSAKLLPTNVTAANIQSLNWYDSSGKPVASFLMGHPDSFNAVSNGAVVSLPGDHFGAVRLLGTAVNGAQLAQPFTVTYEDGTTTTQNVSLSDWTGTGTLQTGESIVASMAYYTTATGVTQNTPVRVYGYTLGVDAMRTLKSVTLPTNPNVVILGVAVTGQVNATLGTLAAPASGSFLAQANGKFVSASSAIGGPLSASQASPGTSETFDVTPAASPAPNALAGIFTLTAHMNGLLVQTTLESSDTTSPVGAVGPVPGGTVIAADEYAWIANADGTLSLQSLVNGRYASLGSADAINSWKGDANNTIKSSASIISGTEKFAFQAIDAPTITSAATATVATGTLFSYQITATSSPSSFGATGLPAGLSIGATSGVISGTPTTAGTFNVTLSATNLGGTGSAALVLTVTAIPTVDAPVVSSIGVDLVEGQAFSYQIVATNSPTSFAATGLPAGLSVNNSTGAILGAPAAVGMFKVMLNAVNAGGTGTGTLTLTIIPDLPTVTLTVTTPTVAVGSGAFAQFSLNLSTTQDHDIQVNYVVKGSAMNGADYVLLKGTKKIKAGKTSKPIKVVPLGSGEGTGVKRTVVLTLAPGDGYSVGTTGKVKIKIVDQ